jgi:hypothetical protein
VNSAGRYWIRRVLAVQRLTLRRNRKYVRNCASQIDCGGVWWWLDIPLMGDHRSGRMGGQRSGPWEASAADRMGVVI